MPHSTASTRDPQGYAVCPYCGRRLFRDRYQQLAVTCAEHADLPLLEPLDDRYVVSEDADS